MSFSVVWGQNKNENMISYLMVIDLREKHSSFWEKKAVHGTFFLIFIFSFPEDISLEGHTELTLFMGP